MKLCVTLWQGGGAGDAQEMQDMQQRLTEAESLAASSSEELLGLQVTRDSTVISFAPLLPPSPQAMVAEAENLISQK